MEKNKANKPKKAQLEPKKKATTKKPPKAKPALKRAKHELDLKGVIFGRAAVQTALLLTGKNKVGYEPHIDSGDFVTVYNLDKVKFSGRKLSTKKYYHYSGYPGGLKEISMGDLMKKDKKKLFRQSVFGMLPKKPFTKRPD